MSKLHIVHSADERLVDRLARLQAEARGAAGEHVGDFIDALTHAGMLADEIANGGELYPVGIRQLANRLRFSLSADTLNLEALRGRS